MEKLDPKLRFPEFDGDWINFTLKDISKKIKDGTHFSPKTFKNGDYKYITSKNVKNGYLDFSNLEFVKEEEHNKIYSSCDVKFGDILLTKDGTIGQCCINTLDEEFSLLSSVAFIRLKEDFSNYFIYQLIVSNKGQKEIEKAIAGQALKRITLTKINEFKFYIPLFKEQQKIATFLTSIDERIALLEKQKQGLETYKKGVMQQLFSQQLRFKDDSGNDFPDWEEKKLGEVCKLQGGYAFKSNEFQENGIPVIRISNISNQTNYIDLNSLVYYKKIDKDESFTIKKGDLIIAMSGATTGKSSIYNLENTAYLNQRVGLFKSLTKELDYIFLIQFIFSDFFKKQLDSVLVAGAQPNISSKDIESLFIPFPKKEEQQKIASFLSAIDVRIEVVSKQIEQSKVFKKGLLQQLFV